MIIKTNQTLWISVVLMLYYFLCVPCSIAEDLPIYTHKDFVYQLKEDGTAIITKYTGIDTSLVIPDRLNNIIVSQIGNYALKDSISIKEIMIPDDVNIEENVFANCLNLEKITISKTHKYLVQDRGVIYNKSGTMLICCPCSLKLEEYNVINGTVEICDKAFNFNDSIKQIVLPEGLKRIGDSAFYFCGSLELINFPNTIEKIGQLSFAACQLKEIVLSDKLETIPFKAFTGCVNLKRIVIPDGVKSIEYKAFANLFSIESVTIPDTVISIDDNAFSKCNEAMIIHCNKGSTAEKYANTKGITYDYNFSNSIEENGLTRYIVLGVSYSLPNHWHHIPVDTENDTFILDINDMKKGMIFIKAQDISEYELMIKTKSNKELMLNSIMTGAMQSINMNDTIFEYTIDENDKLGVLKIGLSDYGFTTIYFEILSNKLFSLSLYTDTYSDDYTEEIIDCIYSIKNTNNTHGITYNKDLKNNGVLVQYEQSNLKYSVWDDWISTSDKNDEIGATICQYFKTSGKPSDGMLTVWTIDNKRIKPNDYFEDMKSLLDYCLNTLNLTNETIDYNFYITENGIIGYKATTKTDSIMNYAIFVSYEESISYCFIMMSTNEKSTNTNWLETVIDTISISH